MIEYSAVIVVPGLVHLQTEGKALWIVITDGEGFEKHTRLKRILGQAQLGT